MVDFKLLVDHVPSFLNNALFFPRDCYSPRLRSEIWTAMTAMNQSSSNDSFLGNLIRSSDLHSRMGLFISSDLAPRDRKAGSWDAKP